jgi:nucleotide-binding universal stress UspA family protein
VYDRILIPTDGSPGTTHVAMQGIDLATQYDADVHVVNVVDTDDLLMGSNESADSLRSHGEAAVGTVEAIAVAHDVPVETTIKEGAPVAEILDYAEEIDADVIVAGTHGRTGSERYLIGSVAERLVRHATCPVMTIRLPESAETVQTEAVAREVADAAIARQGYEATVTSAAEDGGMWIVEAETAGGELVVYVDAVTRRTMVLEKG